MLVQSCACADRWEHGSDFHLSAEHGPFEAPWLWQRHTLWGSGRDALRALAAWGRRRYGWRRIVVPTYFCDEVVAALERELPIVRYPDGPDLPPPTFIEARSDDLVLVVDYFGVGRANSVVTQGVVVEDLTHDPLAQPSARARYAVASLRKTLPLPDGGVLWSPGGETLPTERLETDLHARTVLERLSAMMLKADYLAGRAVDKSAFRAAFVESERRMAACEVSGISQFSRDRLRSLPAARWHRTRARNRLAFRDAFGEQTGVCVVDVPFAVTLQFESPGLREQVRTRLIAERIYPAVLWPSDASLSRRLLTIHCDFRYDVDDMIHVASAVRRSGDWVRLKPDTTPECSGSDDRSVRL